MTSLLTPAKSLSVVPDALHKGTGDQRMRAAAKEYESVFVSSMLSQMFAGIPTSGMFHAGQAEDSWRGMLINEYGRSITEAGGIGLADSVYRELLRTQEGTAQ